MTSQPDGGLKRKRARVMERIEVCWIVGVVVSASSGLSTSFLETS
jgi:hypothetical protein